LALTVSGVSLSAHNSWDEDYILSRPQISRDDNDLFHHPEESLPNAINNHQ
jgi:hypothetical protein